MQDEEARGQRLLAIKGFYDKFCNGQPGPARLLDPGLLHTEAASALGMPAK